ncbi:MAG TPA: hypothetical protein VGC47_03085 [Acidimicrobiia bacterium]|jgi:hypothetical protein
MDAPLVLVGTKDGLIALGSDTARLPGREIDHVQVADDLMWIVSDGRAVWRGPVSGDPSLVAELSDERPNCLLVTDDRVLVGASNAALFELDGDQVVRVASFDATPGRDAWYTPWGGPPDIRSMASGPEGNLYVNVHVGGVVRSTDEGATWVDTMDIHADVHQVIADPTRAGYAYAATARGLAVTTTGGNEWSFVTDGLDAAYCRAVAIGADSIILSAAHGPGGNRSAVYRRPLDGGRFERCTAGLPEWFSSNVDTFCLAAGRGFIAAADPSGTVYTSQDDGVTWAEAADGLPGARCLVIV